MDSFPFFFLKKVKTLILLLVSLSLRPIDLKLLGYSKVKHAFLLLRRFLSLFSFGELRPLFIFLMRLSSSLKMFYSSS